jgi:predicted dehydrogenase
MDIVNWATIGCSDIVERRAADAILQQPNSHITAFHSRTLPRAQSFATKYGAERAYDDIDALLADDRIHAVYVATEVDRHAEQTIAAAEAGKHVLVEKPMALTPDECRAMIDAATRHNVNLAVAYYARFFDKSAAMQRVIAEGHLGKVVRATITQLAYANPDPSNPKYWRVTGRGGGNLLADVGSHRLDLLMYWLGRPARVAGLADRLSMPYEAPDTETALAQFANGAHATVLASANIPRGLRKTAGPSDPGGDTSIELYGTEGALLTDPWSDAPIQLLGPNAADFQPITCTRPSNAHAPLMHDFATAILEHRPPRFSPVEALWTTAIIHGAAESSRTNRFVDLSPFTA